MCNELENENSFTNTNTPKTFLRNKPGEPCHHSLVPDTPSHRAQKRHHDSGESVHTTPKRTRTIAEGMTNPRTETQTTTRCLMHNTPQVEGIRYAPPITITSAENRLNPFNPIRPYLASIEPLPNNMTIFLRLFDDYI